LAFCVKNIKGTNAKILWNGQLPRLIVNRFLNLRTILFAAMLAAFWLPEIRADVGGQNLLGHQNQWEKRGYFGFHIGFIGTGQLIADSASYEIKPGFTFGVKFDSRISGPYYWGVTADIHRLHILDTGQYLFDISLNLRRSFFSKSALVSFRPGVGAGFGHIANFRQFDPTTYLLLKGGMEVIFFSDQKVAYLFELQLLGSPVGGRPGLALKLNPMIVARAGLLL